MIERPVFFKSAGLRLAGVMRCPDGLGTEMPSVLLVHGSLEQDRDGNLLERRGGQPAFKKNFFLEISRRLCQEGIATFSWDRRGFGESEKPKEKGSYLDDVVDTRAALDALSSQDSIDPCRTAVLGQSAGVYTACLLAKGDNRPKAYVLQGGLYRDYAEMMAFNYIRTVLYAEKGPENLAWIEENDLWSLVIGLNLSEIEKRARKGETEHDLSYKGKSFRLYHDPTCYSEELASSRQFRHINKPTLVIHGACDLNVPVGDASSIGSDLKAHGNEDVELVIVPESDHSFQKVPEDEDLRLRERMSLECFKRPYVECYFETLIDFLKRKL